MEWIVIVSALALVVSFGYISYEVNNHTSKKKQS
jgi:hypothetical protein